jgi:hypothetical protein
MRSDESLSSATEDGERVAGEALTEIRKADWIELMVEQDFRKVRRARGIAARLNNRRQLR